MTCHRSWLDQVEPSRLDQPGEVKGRNFARVQQPKKFWAPVTVGPSFSAGGVGVTGLGVVPAVHERNTGSIGVNRDRLPILF